MKKLLSLLVLASAISSNAQTIWVTNKNVDLVWPQAVEDTLRKAYQADAGARAKGAMPYDTVQTNITYKEFLGLKLAKLAQDQAPALAAETPKLQLDTLNQVLPILQRDDPDVFDRLYRIGVKRTE